MEFLYPQTITDQVIGGKASNLLKLDKMGMNVPKWGVIPSAVLLDQIDNSAHHDKVISQFENLKISTGLMQAISSYFGDDYAHKKYAVRSSGTDEDGQKFSFAGQFETFLNVAFDQLEEKIIAIWQSAISERVINYRKENNLAFQYGISVIIQELIPSDVSGVAFGINPVNGNIHEKIVSSVYGLGEGLVSGELDADTFTVSGNNIEKQIVKKPFLFQRKLNSEGIEKKMVSEERQSVPSLNDAQILSITKVLERLSSELGAPQDIEFAFHQGSIFLLQTRPITGAAKKGEYIIWDNSNIVESYPGITTPLTFSFIIKMYEAVYRQFSSLLGVSNESIDQQKNVFANTLGLVRGRVYYNLKSWYQMLAMLPGYSINAEFMEKMMGVKEKFDLDENLIMSKSTARFRIVKMLMKMLKLQRKLPKERRKFLRQLNDVMGEYGSIDFSSLTIPEIVNKYKAFESNLLLKWKAPLINDFFAMIWFGMLQKQTEKYFPDNPNLHNDLLCGSQDIISVEPIHRTIAISNMVLNNSQAKAYFQGHSADQILLKLETNPENDQWINALKVAIDSYIEKFGERCVGELKLESISYAQDPKLYIKIIKSYVEQGITKKDTHSTVEQDLRMEAQKVVAEKFGHSFMKKRWFNYVLNKARDAVSNRENLRFERTRGFGMVRKMFSAIGEKLYSKGKIEHPRDIFYLELDEIKKMDLDIKIDNLRTLIKERKDTFEDYRSQKPPEERFFTYGFEFKDEYIYSTEKLGPISEDLKGIGCCPGRVEGTVRIVLDPTELESLNGDILVTSSTDPGWVTLFPTASAIIVERGSLLSHSAIVSREMSIPCIVSVTGLLRTLKTGDRIIMDGSSGEIQILSS